MVIGGADPPLSAPHQGRGWPGRCAALAGQRQRAGQRHGWPLDRVGAGDYCGSAATIVTVHKFSSRRPDFLVPFGRVGHRDAIEETWGRGARPKADEAFAAGEPAQW